MQPATEMIAYIGAAVVIAGVCTSAVLRKKRAIQIEQQLKRVTGHYDDTPGEGFWKRFGAVIGQKTVRRPRDLQSLSKLLRRAGFYSSNAPFIFAAFQLATATIACVGVVLFAVGAGASLRTLVLRAVAGFAIGYLLPRFAVRCAGKSRQRYIGRELPLFIDMLLLLLRSGLGLERCFREIERFGVDAVPRIHATVKLLLIDLDHGRSYDEALIRWAERVSDPAALEVARHLQQSLTHGTEVAKALSVFAQRYVDQRLVFARETAGRRSSMVTLVTVGLFLPPLLIILAGPAFSQLARVFHAMNGP